MSTWIEEQGDVLEVEGFTARVRIQRQSTCGGCSARAGCGSGILSEVLGRRAVELTVGHSGDLRPGDQVTLGIRDHALVSGAMVMYLLPLLGLVAGPGLLMLLWPAAGEGLHLLAAGLGLGLGFWGVRGWLRRRAPDMAPVVLARHPSVGSEGVAVGIHAETRKSGRTP